MASVAVIVTGALTGLGYYYMATWQPEEMIASLNTAPWRALNVDAYSFQNVADFTAAEQKLMKMTHSPQYRQNPIPSFLLGRLHQTLEQDKQAKADYQQALKISQQNWLAQANYRLLINETNAHLAIYYYKSNGSSASRHTLAQIQDKSRLSQEALISALSDRLESPDRADFRFLLGKALRQELLIQQSRTELKQAQKLAQQPQLHLEIQNYQQTQMPRKIGKLSPMTRYYSLAGIYYQHQASSIPKAVAFLKKALQSTPSLEWLHAELALAYREQHQFKAAAKEAKVALAINPDLYHAYLTLGDLGVDQEQYTAAIQHFETAKTIMSHLPDGQNQGLDANIHNQIGFAFECMNQLSSAQANYRQAMTEAQERDDEEAFTEYEYAQDALSRIADETQSDKKVLSQGHTAAL